MEPTIQIGNATVFQGDCLEVLKSLPDNSVDSIVTDPPYGLSDNKYVADTITKWVSGQRDFIPDSKGFMGKSWDAFVPPPAVWDECLRVLKPGGHLLAFFGSRTQDIGSLSIRLAGFEIRDSIAWIYGSGFPKSLDISKAIDNHLGAEREKIRIDASEVRNPKATGNGTDGMEGGTRPWIEKALEVGYHEKDSDIPASEEAKHWNGWGTALKPAIEPIVVARKPVSEKSVAPNVLKWGTGGINIGESRIGNGDGGRWPGNVVFGHTEWCKQVGVVEDSYAINKTEDWTGFGQIERPDYQGSEHTVSVDIWECVEGCPIAELEKQVEGTSRFFYQAKANKKDRNEGLDDLKKRGKVFNGKSSDNAGNAEGSVEKKFSTQPSANFHPTVKPTSLMRYLVNLVTPAGGVVLDPFTGSGSTGKAALLEGFGFVGIELTEEYLPIIEGRLEHAQEERTKGLF